MDIDKIINDVTKDYKKECAAGPGDLQNINLKDLCASGVFPDEIKIEIYKRIKSDAINYIDGFTSSPDCKDPNKSHGMFKCSHETFQACIRDFGIDYFKLTKLFHDVKREKLEGGFRFNDELLYIGLEVYETLCDYYRKVFQIVDCCAFLGISKDYMYTLNDIHARFLKKLHTSTEHSLRIGALTGRGNVTGHAIILNHDYDYTRTTQVIHTNNNQAVAARDLPQLQTQDIVLSDNSGGGAFVPDGL